jgi:signal transduction histidine kinase/FixJ family two-component response regulator
VSELDRDRPRVLVVDDNRPLAENLVELFEDLDVEGRVATTAAEALEAIQDRTALAVVDVGLPDASGLQLLRSLRAANPNGEVILMTGQGSLETAIAAVRHGAYAYLLKPVDTDELLTLVERALAQVQLRAERTSLARALAASEALYRGVVDHVEAWIVGIDREDRVALMNRRASEGLEQSGLAENGTGAPVERLFGAPFAEALVAARGGETAPFELTHGERVVRWQLTAVAEARTVVDVLALGLDVTEQRALERRNARAEAMAAIGVLTTGLAHEIRNPLNAAGLQLQLLSRRLRKLELEGEQGDALGEPVALVRRELSRLSSLLDDFLGLARPTVLRAEPVDLGELVRHVVSLLTPLCAEKGVQLEARVTEDLVAEVERGRIEQVLTNLVGNACDAVESGGSIAVALGPAEGAVELVVGDSGPGFGEAPEKLLQPFFTTKSAGTGLGLTIVRRIAEMHGGELSLGASALGGAEVRMRLPRHQ